jgi:acetyl/propionyl-CoA carboxylase alpha subunit
VCWGRTRGEAIEKTLWCLDRFVVIGVVTNIPFLRALIDHAEFRAGRLHTHFLEEHRIKPQAADMESAIVAAAVACELGFTGKPIQSGRELRPDDAASPWRQAAGWRIVS